MNSLGEIAVEVESTSDCSKVLETVDRLQHSVVGNLKATVGRGEHWKGDVGQVNVVNKNQAADSGQVWCCE